MGPTTRLVLATILSALALSTPASAARCPIVMIVLDRSNSMNDPAGGPGTLTKLEIAKTALSKLITQYGDQLPFGFTDFSSGFGACTDGVEVVVKPDDGTKAAVTAAIMAVKTEGGTNTGPAIDVVVALPEMNDASRPGTYILLVTDGEPNCPGTVGTENTDPEYTVGAVQRAADKGIKTFVVGFGSLPDTAKMAMNMMAAAGGEPCTGASCNGQQYYAAESDAGLDAAITAISSVIVGEFGGACDDSCYANGCPNAGQICVKNTCVADPCAGVSATCAPGDYCYTDGTSPGTCTPACPATCPTGQACRFNGCEPDACLALSCPADSICVAGTCQSTTCATPCAPQLSCIASTCQDDPCRYVTCPIDSTCTPHVGTCVASGPSKGGDGTTKNRGTSGCAYAPTRAGTGISLVALCFGLLVLRRRRHARRNG